MLWLDPLLYVIAMYCQPADSNLFAYSPMQIFFSEVNDLLFFSCHVNNLGWSECIFAASSTEQTLPEPPVEINMGYPLQIVLVDVATNIVQRQRVLGVSNKFSVGMYSLWLKHRNNNPISNHEFNQRALDIYKRYPTTEEMSKHAMFEYHAKEKPPQ